MAPQNVNRNEGVEPTRGIQFDDTRYSNHKYLVADDDRQFKQGQIVHISNGSKVYGPYRLEKIVAEGGGKQRWLAFTEGSTAISNKPKTKAELEQEAAAKDAKLEAARNQLREQGIEPTF